MAREVVIGDIIEIPTSKGLAYAQCSHIHWDYGHLIRALPGFFQQRPVDFNELAAKEELFVVFYPVQAAVNKRFLNQRSPGTLTFQSTPESSRFSDLACPTGPPTKWKYGGSGTG